MSNELLRIVDTIHRDKNIDTETVFTSIEDAIRTAARRFYGEEDEIVATIDRLNGKISASRNGVPIDAETLGRISAQSAKQIMIQKIREAERDTLYDDFLKEKGTIITGIVQRYEGGAITVNVGKTDALLPRSEQIPGETYRPGERVQALVLEVRKKGQRVQIILSRAHHDFVRRLFEQEIPEIQEKIIEIRAIAREAGYRTKIAVSSIDSKVDCVGACVGMRGARIKNINDELNGERIDIVRYNESLQAMIPNALSPAKIEDVQIYPRIGRAVVIVREEELSLAIGKRGQNVRLASKLTGIDIEIMTYDELNEEIEKAESNLSKIPGMTEEVIDTLIEEGLFSYDDLSVMEAETIAEVTGMDEDSAQGVVEFAEEMAEAAPQETSSRSSLLSSPSPSPSASARQAADQLLGPADPVPQEKAPTFHDVFGNVLEERVVEDKLTVEQLFRDAEEPEAAAADVEEEASAKEPPASE